MRQASSPSLPPEERRALYGEAVRMYENVLRGSEEGGMRHVDEGEVHMNQRIVLMVLRAAVSSEPPSGGADEGGRGSRGGGGGEDPSGARRVAVYLVRRANLQRRAPAAYCDAPTQEALRAARAWERESQ